MATTQAFVNDPVQIIYSTFPCGRIYASESKLTWKNVSYSQEDNISYILKSVGSFLHVAAER